MSTMTSLYTFLAASYMDFTKGTACIDLHVNMTSTVEDIKAVVKGPTCHRGTL